MARARARCAVGGVPRDPPDALEVFSVGFGVRVVHPGSKLVENKKNITKNRKTIISIKNYENTFKT